MTRYENKSQMSSTPPNPDEWGSLSAAEVETATLMQHKRRGRRYIPEYDVKRLEAKGWSVVGKDYSSVGTKKARAGA